METLENPTLSTPFKNFILFSICLMSALLLACIVFLSKVLVSGQRQYKFIAAVLLLLSSSAVMTRNFLLYTLSGFDCNSPVIVVNLATQGIVQNGAYWLFSFSMWVDSLNLQEVLGINSLFQHKRIRKALNILIWTLIFTYNYLIYFKK